MWPAGKNYLVLVRKRTLFIAEMFWSFFFLLHYLETSSEQDQCDFYAKVYLLYLYKGFRMNGLKIMET